MVIFLIVGNVVPNFMCQLFQFLMPSCLVKHQIRYYYKRFLRDRTKNSTKAFIAFSNFKF